MFEQAIVIEKDKALDARSTLIELYHEWQRLTEEEGTAIRSSVWNDVTDCQNAKLLLQQKILDATALLKEELKAGVHNRKEVETEFQVIINQLISLEVRNREWLTDQRRVAEAHRDELAQSSRNLRQIHRAYARNRNSSWHSYS